MSLYTRYKNTLALEYPSLEFNLDEAYAHKWGGDDSVSVFFPIKGTTMSSEKGELSSYFNVTLQTRVKNKNIAIESFMFVIDYAEETSNAHAKAFLNGQTLMEGEFSQAGNLLSEKLYEHPDLDVSKTTTRSSSQQGWWGCMDDCLSGFGIAPLAVPVLGWLCKAGCAAVAAGGSGAPVCASCIGIAIGFSVGMVVTCVIDCS